MGNPNGHLTHGLYNHHLYAVWRGMKQRCNNPKCRGYKWYGAKGISVCAEWLDFKNFYNWAISTGYEEGLTIERKDPTGNYAPSNCEWKTMSEQQTNKTNTHYLTVGDETHSITEWSKLTGIPRMTITNRILLGWSPDEVVTGRRKRGASCG